MFSDRIEILSRGTIPPGQTMEGFFAGESVPVNQKLSDMLLQLHISERTGRGVPKITEVYGKGTYEFRENSIVVSIPFTRVSTEDEDPRWTQDGTQEDSKGSSEDEKIKRILEFCQTPKGIEQEKYIEQIFFFMGVRFIAINDNYDSADYVGGIGEIDVAFKGILYDFFSEEQSSKVSLTLDTKRGNGKYMELHMRLTVT